MNQHKLFTIVTNIFGLNFYEQLVPLSSVFLFNFIANLQQIACIYKIYAMNSQPLPLFKTIDFVQIGLPLIIKNFFMVRAIRLRSLDLKFDLETKLIYKPSLVLNNQKKFLYYVVTAVVLILMKIGLSSNWQAATYNLTCILSNLMNASSDFFFVYHILCLTDHVKHVRRNFEDFDAGLQVLKIIEIRETICCRYSTNLALNIALYFVLMIVALFWIFIRIVFHFYKTIYGNFHDLSKTDKNIIKNFPDYASYFFFIQPCFYLLSIFMAYRNFSVEVKYQRILKFAKELFIPVLQVDHRNIQWKALQ